MIRKHGLTIGSVVALAEDGPDVSHAETLVAHVAGHGTVADVLVVVGDGDQSQGVAALRSAKRKLGGRWEGAIGRATWWVDDRQLRGKNAYDLRLDVEHAVAGAAPDGEACQG